MTLTLGTPSTATGLTAGTFSKDFKFIPLTTDKGVYLYIDGSNNIIGRVANSSGTTISSIGSPTTIVAAASTPIDRDWETSIPLCQ